MFVVCEIYPLLRVMLDDQCSDIMQNSRGNDDFSNM